MKTKPTTDKLEAQVASASKVLSSALLAALDRSIRKCLYATSSVTVVKHVRLNGRHAQIQVRVTKDKNDWFEVKHAGIKCS